MRGMIFSGPMIRALIAGRKTQTRRIVKPQPELVSHRWGARWEWPSHKCKSMVEPRDMGGLSPYGMRGDRLYVRETWQAIHVNREDVRAADRIPTSRAGGFWTVAYAATDPMSDESAIDRGFAWRSPIHMPLWASRFELELTSVRVEQLQCLSREDAIAEGAFRTDYGLHEQPISIDGGATWHTHRQPRAGWSMVETERHEQCLGSPQMGFAAFFNELHGGARWNLKPGPSPWDVNPWVWVLTFVVHHRTE